MEVAVAVVAVVVVVREVVVVVAVVAVGEVVARQGVWLVKGLSKLGTNISVDRPLLREDHRW